MATPTEKGIKHVSEVISRAIDELVNAAHPTPQPAPVPVAPAIPEVISALEFFVENFGSWNGNDNATYHTGVLSRMLAEMQAERGEG
jgi:hypothetical protein